MRSAFTRLAVLGLPALAAAAALAAPVPAAATGTAQASGSAAVPNAAITTSVTPASSPADCPVGDLCFWVDAGYVGKMGMVSGNNSNWNLFGQPACSTATWNDCASAIYAHGQYDNARVFRNSSGGGGGACLPKGTMWSNLTSHYFDNGYNMNDSISSNDWISTACP
jgi:peptidase inhibitor family I36